MSKARLALYGLLTSLVLLGALEGLLRLTIPLNSLLFAWERADSPYTILPTGMLQARPNQALESSDGSYRWKIFANNLGLRETAPTEGVRPKNQFRVLALGDSYMYGYSVTQGKTLCDQLEHLLPSIVHKDRVEVLNAAIPGSSAFDMLMRWQYLSRTLQLDALLLGAPHNAIRQNSLKKHRNSWYNEVKGAPFINSYIYLGIRRIMAPLLRPRYAESANGPDHAGSIDDLWNIAHDARKRGLPVWMVEWPYQWSQARDHNFARDPRLDARLGPEGVLFSAHALSQRSCWGFLDLGHPSEAGHRAIALTLAAAVARGTSDPRPATTPSCDEVEGIGPGKGIYKEWKN